MEIKFCDLCNQSIPDIHVIDGRAKALQGKLICEECISRIAKGRSYGLSESPRSFKKFVFLFICSLVVFVLLVVMMWSMSLFNTISDNTSLTIDSTEVENNKSSHSTDSNVKDSQLIEENKVRDESPGVDAQSADSVVRIEDVGNGKEIFSIEEDTEKLYPVVMRTQYGYADILFGYIDRKGKLKIKPKFNSASIFCDGLAVVGVGGTRSQYGIVYGMKSGLINKDGIFVVEPNEFQSIRDFSEGLAAACENDKWGIINRNGTYIVEPIFQNVKPFSAGLAAVCVDEKWGYINKLGKVIISPVYSEVRPFKESVAAVAVSVPNDNVTTAHDGEPDKSSVEQLWGLIDKTGSIVIETKYDRISDFSEGFAAIFIDGKWGYIDQQGVMEIEPQFEEAGQFSEGLAPVLVDTKWGFINRQGAMVIEPKFDAADSFSEGLAKVGMETSTPSLGRVGDIPWSLSINTRNLYGYIDTIGNMVIEPQFENAGTFSNGIAPVSIGEIIVSGYAGGFTEGYIDQSGDYIWDPATVVELDVSNEEHLLRQLCTTNLTDHFNAAESLVKIGSSVLPDLLINLNDRRWYVSITSAWMIGEIGDQSAVEPLINMLNNDEMVDPSAYVSYVGDMSYKAQKEMSIYSTPNSFPSWNLKFKSRAAAIALGKLGDNRAVHALIDCL